MRCIMAFFLLAPLLFSCSPSLHPAEGSVRNIRFVAEYIIPANQFRGTLVGGLSGIDYSPQNKSYYIISDDRADSSHLRFYTAKISLSDKGIEKFEWVDVTRLLKSDGQPFHNRKQNPLAVPDPEGIRFHRPSKNLVWTSEGERHLRSGTQTLTHPAIFIADEQGNWVDTFSIPENLRMTAEQKGPRNNGVLEGLAFSPDGSKLYVSVEEPLYEDGPRAGLFDSSAWVRLIKFDVASRLPEAQYAYQIDPVVKEPISEGLFVVNGITDILTVNEHQLLVTERSFSTGRLGNNIRVYLADLRGAEDISPNRSLAAVPPLQPVKKTLLLDMDGLGRLVDNIEGASFGPRLPNGKRSLLFIADNNFSKHQKNQLLLFEVD